MSLLFDLNFLLSLQLSFFCFLSDQGFPSLSLGQSNSLLLLFLLKSDFFSFIFFLFFELHAFIFFLLTRLGLCSFPSLSFIFGLEQLLIFISQLVQARVKGLNDTLVLIVLLMERPNFILITRNPLLHLRLISFNFQF